MCAWSLAVCPLSYGRGFARSISMIAAEVPAWLATSIEAGAKSLYVRCHPEWD